MISTWLQARIEEFQALRGRSVDSWHGVEMAVRGIDDFPEFGGPDVPCLQLCYLSARMDDHVALTITTYQDNDVWGLIVQQSDNRNTRDARLTSGYRLRSLAELPVGRIDTVVVYLDADVLAEVELQLGDRQLHLVAGETEDNADGRLRWYRLDESVLVFLEPNLVQTMTWTPERGRLTHLS
jgi:hypothetical protein